MLAATVRRSIGIALCLAVVGLAVAAPSPLGPMAALKLLNSFFTLCDAHAGQAI